MNGHAITSKMGAITMNDPRGSIWRQWDLHIHTPASYDYLDKSVTSAEIVDALIAAQVVMPCLAAKMARYSTAFSQSDGCAMTDWK
jgi:hypothetical protein